MNIHSFHVFSQKARIDNNGAVAVVRTADAGACSKNQCEKQTVQGMTATACCCNSDLCNAGPRFGLDNYGQFPYHTGRTRLCSAIFFRDTLIPFFLLKLCSNVVNKYQLS